MPDLDIKWVRYSTGEEVMAKLIAEKDNPQANVVYGTTVTELARVKDPDGYWTAIDIYVTTFSQYQESKRALVHRGFDAV